MVDNLTPPARSRNMRQIRSKNTKPELIVRSVIHRMGFRFSLCYKGLPCKPDIVLPKHKAVVFVHGCFWHRHKGCPDASTPKTRRAFWEKKFADNVARDRRNQRELWKLGWKILTIWECEMADHTRLERKLRAFLGGGCMAHGR